MGITGTVETLSYPGGPLGNTLSVTPDWDSKASRRAPSPFFSVQHPWHALGNCGQQTRRSQKLQPETTKSTARLHGSSPYFFLLLSFLPPEIISGPTF